MTEKELQAGLARLTSQVIGRVEQINDGTPVIRAHATLFAAAVLLIASGCDKARACETFAGMLDMAERVAK
jgi:cell division protein ZapA (FtsZ GTPase activity inhibitor)